MSLLEALLNEGWRDPREVYIALRADGLKGSGTIDDPFDGGTRPGPEVRGRLTCNRKEFVVRMFNHGLAKGNSVTIENAKGPDASLFNGVKQVEEVLSPSEFTLLLGAVPTAPLEVPYSWNGYITAQLPNGTKPAIQVYWPVAKVTGAVTLTRYDGVIIGGDFSPPNQGFAGAQIALGPNFTSFHYRLPFLPSADITPSTTPAYLECSFARILHRFDEVMRGVQPNSVVHLGSGTFETRGYGVTYISNPGNFSEVFVGYALRRGQRLLGSGMGATTLKLVLPLDDINLTAAVGTGRHPLEAISTPADYAEVADLTVDCNAPLHVAPYGFFPAPVTCGAVAMYGSFMSVRRVRAINFCTQGAAECFVIFLGDNASQPPKLNVVEDCIMEKPGENNTHETTFIANVGDLYGNAVSPINRHNYINGTLPQERRLEGFQ